MSNKKKELIPAILEKAFFGIEKKVSLAKGVGIKLVQVDICDGRLTPDKTFASGGCLSSFLKLKKIQKNIKFEIDLIADLENGPKGRGDKFLESVKILNPERVVFHSAGVKNWEHIFQFFSKTKIKIGLGIWLDDLNTEAKKLLKKYPFDYIQVMGIEKVGFGGQKLSGKVFLKIKYFSKNFPELPIQIDGGVKLENAKKLSKAGVNRFVSGSGFYGAESLKKRKNEFEKEMS